MDDEIEDIVGDIKYTDSQKSVAASNVYSLDFTDNSSDKNNSFGKDTYVIECDDSDDIDSMKTFQLHNNKSIIDLKNYSMKINQDTDAQCEDNVKINKSASTSLHKCCILSQETFTQTSKTIIELAETENSGRKIVNQSLETQTSLISIIENKTVEYKIEVSDAHTNFIKNKVMNHNNDHNVNSLYAIACDQVFISSLDDGSSKFPISEIEIEKTVDDESGGGSSTGEIIKIINDDSNETILNEEQNEIRYENNSDFRASSDSSMDVEEYSFDNKCQTINNNQDSISDVSEVPTSLDNDVEDLYKKITSNIELHQIERACEPEARYVGILTPLTEESTTKKQSLMDLTPNVNNLTDDGTESDVIFTNNAGIKIKILPSNDAKKESFRLPSIPNTESCPNSPHFYLFSINSSYKAQNKSNNCPLGGQKDRWEIESKELASGEGTLINGRNDLLQGWDQCIQLPPIHLEGHGIKKNQIKHDTSLNPKCATFITPTELLQDSISIKGRIKELKTTNKKAKEWTRPKYLPTTESKTSRSVSPNSLSPDDSRLGDVAERGCEALCVELIRRLRSSSWLEVADTLQDTSILLEKFWGVITENRIADLIRHVSVHVDSPRTQLARSACNTLASIIKNTNYTKKPNFYEAMTALLAKTGSFSRPVRRAANMALDDVVCGVEFSHAVTALCVHGTSHKSPLVRCAAARLLVVCCALGGGGRELLRARPAAAAAARRRALRSLAALLDDNNIGARKYAERLYSMLRPLSNFEAYYLTDVDVELASRQMKKYDQILLCGPRKEIR
ncbi:uncharacterized protein LOC113519068 [Galleria mellonella]|uniref:Uncharacterized protein LOC113519068 n=1 Tax=Galleria mellonella TaxID=7137 RepID=A0ABM3N3H3_GALME|nr:uncharacterized protein LOC113519068 [Galleria mellonella]